MEADTALPLSLALISRWAQPLESCGKLENAVAQIVDTAVTRASDEPPKIILVGFCMYHLLVGLRFDFVDFDFCGSMCSIKLNEK